MIQTVINHTFIGTPAPSNYEFIGTSATTKHIIPQLFGNSDSELSCLDIGFGRGELARMVAETHRNVVFDGMDAWLPTCSNPELANVFRNVWCVDISKIDSVSLFHALKDYDYIFLMDVIEHLPPKEAKDLLMKLLMCMGKNSYLVVSTPLWFFPQGNVEPGDFEEHKCMIPVQSFLDLEPISYNINARDLVGMFLLDKSALKNASKFFALEDRGYDKHQAITDIQNHALSIDEQWHALSE